MLMMRERTGQRKLILVEPFVLVRLISFATPRRPSAIFFQLAAGAFNAHLESTRLAASCARMNVSQARLAVEANKPKKIVCSFIIIYFLPRSLLAINFHQIRVFTHSLLKSRVVLLSTDLKWISLPTFLPTTIESSRVSVSRPTRAMLIKTDGLHSSSASLRNLSSQTKLTHKLLTRHKVRAVTGESLL